MQPAAAPSPAVAAPGARRRQPPRQRSLWRFGRSTRYVTHLGMCMLGEGGPALCLQQAACQVANKLKAYTQPAPPPRARAPLPPTAERVAQRAADGVRRRWVGAGLAQLHSEGPAAAGHRLAGACSRQKAGDHRKGLGILPLVTRAQPCREQRVNPQLGSQLLPPSPAPLCSRCWCLRRAARCGRLCTIGAPDTRRCLQPAGAAQVREGIGRKAAPPSHWRPTPAPTIASTPSFSP
jgi:hypothetical protein